MRRVILLSILFFFSIASEVIAQETEVKFPSKDEADKLTKLDVTKLKSPFKLNWDGGKKVIQIRGENEFFLEIKGDESKGVESGQMIWLGPGEYTASIYPKNEVTSDKEIKINIKVLEYLFEVYIKYDDDDNSKILDALNDKDPSIHKDLRKEFENNNKKLASDDDLEIEKLEKKTKWLIKEKIKRYYIEKNGDILHIYFYLDDLVILHEFNSPASDFTNQGKIGTFYDKEYKGGYVTQEIKSGALIVDYSLVSSNTSKPGSGGVWIQLGESVKFSKYEDMRFSVQALTGPTEFEVSLWEYGKCVFQEDISISEGPASAYNIVLPDDFTSKISQINLTWKGKTLLKDQLSLKGKVKINTIWLVNR